MADEGPLQPMLPPLGKPSAAAAKKKSTIIQFNILKDQLSMTTWLLLGAVIQGLAVLTLPAFYAILPAILLLSYRVLDNLLMTAGLKKNRFMDNVIMGKFTGQIPNTDGVYSSEPADENVVSFQLITRSNHPLGVLAPGAREINALAQNMFRQLAEERETYGFLGSKTWVGTDERSGGNHIMTMMYFRTLEGVHRFAHGPLHTDTWNWWNAKGKKYGYLSIAHELYSSPRNQWENIYINSELMGLPGTMVKVKKMHKEGKEDGWEYVNPVIDARKGKLARQYGRVNRSYENIGTDVDYNY
ncbi:hypothetical protein N7520_006055 [Penicillium odoratum]|uniref:uncharacterized protein n=1 Tax=Penicillium odoratum TaxID=1167516 RepID=UPI002548E53F|nr:uncharacterized protein N7520_006055 [Penicillium odoratum]KAJ5758899.1 hypothetical protein N7520_006055 [Penicillium odoratum]